MEILPILLSTFAVWRVAHMIGYEKGPLGLFQQLQGLIARKDWDRLGEFINCFYCVSTVIAIWPAVAFSNTFGEFVLLLFGISGGAGILFAFTNYYEEQ